MKLYEGAPEHARNAVCRYCGLLRSDTVVRSYCGLLRSDTVVRSYSEESNLGLVYLSKKCQIVRC